MHGIYSGGLFDKMIETDAFMFVAVCLQSAFDPKLQGVCHSTAVHLFFKNAYAFLFSKTDLNKKSVLFVLRTNCSNPYFFVNFPENTKPMFTPIFKPTFNKLPKPDL